MGSGEQDLLGELLTIFFISSVVQGRRLLSTLLSPVLCVIASVSVSENPFRIFSILEIKKLLKFSTKSLVEELLEWEIFVEMHELFRHFK